MGLLGGSMAPLFTAPAGAFISSRVDVLNSAMFVNEAKHQCMFRVACNSGVIKKN
jgi:hypothetical protein